MLPKDEPNFYWKLFSSTFIISGVTVGGGFVIIPLLKAKYVDEYHWIDEKEALDLVSIAQTAPGAVAINAAVAMGYKMAGLKGMLTAVLGTSLPPLLTISLVAMFYSAVANNEYVRFLLEGMQCGATVLIIDVAYNLLKKELKKHLAIPMAIMIGSFIANYVLGINIMYIIPVDAIIGFFLLRDPKYN